MSVKTDSVGMKPGFGTNPESSKLYGLYVNDRLYDAHDNLETVQKWFESFVHVLRQNKVPHRWFNQFIQNGKLVSLKMEVREYTSYVSIRYILVK